MDPFIEDQEWEDFHSSFNTVMAEALASGVEPRYVVRIQRRVYFECRLRYEAPVASAAAVTSPSLAPVECLLPMPQERRETFLVIREQRTLEIVTVIETLSPANKRASSDGREQYLAKRQEILQSHTNLVELDLLRGGRRLPVVGMPLGDYFAIVSRGHRRPRADVFHWTIRQPLPTIHIPLKPGEPEVPLDLQQVFTTVYDRARYQLSLNYTARLAVPPTEPDAVWLRQLPLSGRDSSAASQETSAGRPSAAGN
jgi:hypothetical protein